MTGLVRQAWIAVITGFAISATLFYSSYATDSDLLALPQAIGFWACMVLRGVHSATKMDFALIALPINAAIYAMCIFVLLHVFRREDSK
jgi:hypothetical protein